MDDDAFKWILDATEAICIPACCRIQLSEFELNFLEKASIQNEAADELLNFLDGWNEYPLIIWWLTE